nr:hypothetical protein [Nanoarchaeum sp.]
MKIDKVYVLGAPGSGKTFLAKKLSKILGIEHFDLDDIFWEKKYSVKRSDEEREKLLQKITKKKQWIAEGVYVSWTNEVIKNSNLVIWLDSPSHVLMWRVLNRYFQRKENFKDTMMLLNSIKEYKQNNQDGYKQHRKLIESHEVDFVYIKSKDEVDNFLKNFLKKMK